MLAINKVDRRGYHQVCIWSLVPEEWGVSENCDRLLLSFLVIMAKFDSQSPGQKGLCRGQRLGRR